MPNYYQVLNSCMGVIIFVLLGLASTRSNNIKMIISNTPLIHQSGFSSLVSFPNPLGTKIKVQMG